jgi:tripeptidyl-peptidase-1
MGEWVQFTTTIAQANTLFNASYQSFVHEGTNQTLTRTLSYSLPQALVGHISTIIPATSFDSQRSNGLAPAPEQPADRSIPASCNNTITPSCLQVRRNLLIREQCTLTRPSGHLPDPEDSGNEQE